MESIFNQEIKTALQVNIVSYRTESSGLSLIGGSGVQHYLISLQKIYSGEQRYLERKLTEFYSLNEELKVRAYRNLPKLPQKGMILFKNHEQLEKRKHELDTYLKKLIERRDTRNSQELIEFLDLDEFCPEILIQKPQMVTKWNCNFVAKETTQQYHVKHCHFLPRYNLFVLAMNSSNKYDKKGKKMTSSNITCKVQIFSFKQLSQVRDSLILKHGDAHLLSTTSSQSTKALTTSDRFSAAQSDDRFAGFDSTPSNNNQSGSSSQRTLSHKVMSVPPNSGNPSALEFDPDPHEIQISQQRSQSERAQRTKNYLRESMVESFASYQGGVDETEDEEEQIIEMLMDHNLGKGKIQAITYCDELDILSLAMSDGSIISFNIKVELDRDNNKDDDDDDDDEYGEQEYDRNLIVKKSYEQMEGYSPETINVEEQKKLHQARVSQQQYFQQTDYSDRFSLEVRLYSRVQVHTEEYKIFDMKADSQRGLIYTVGDDRRVCILDVNLSQIVSKLKTANSKALSLTLDPDSKRLYAATLEGLILVFNVSLTSGCILLVHTIDFGKGLFATKLDFDSNKNIIFCLLKQAQSSSTQSEAQQSQIVCIQLDQKREKYSAIVDRIQSPQAFPNEHFICQAWLSRVQSTLMTASDFGILRFYDLESGCKEPILFQLAPPGGLTPNQLHDFKSTFLTYNRERNLIFAGAKDGRFGVWRLPDTWRSREIDELEREFEYSRRQMMRIREKAKKNKLTSPQK
ncbi:hypothetical protein FGO68_gene9612 [Halteria grandinella]|uniref:PX domain-containing protein n=1 Tax=Halteria grandinella TaxID=5974 RepID=A0A8J8T548_HALGN|nr:hypothetical protein FGO68_gene9612 [Halteria grandinella]